MSLKNLHCFKASEAVDIDEGWFTFEVDYSVSEGFKGPHDYDTVLVRMPVACLGEIVVVGRVRSSMPLYGDDGYTIGVQVVKVSLVARP